MRELVWVGCHSLAPESRGLVALGAPIGSPAFVAAQLQRLSASHAGLLQRIRGLEDLQASWLLLLFCAPPRCNHVLRLPQPGLTAAFAVANDAALLDCLSDLLQCGPLPALPARVAQLPLRLGGLGAPGQAPAFVKGQVRQALSLALQAVLEAGDPEAYPLAALRAWKLWLLLLRMPQSRKTPAPQAGVESATCGLPGRALEDVRWTQLLLDVRRSLPPEAGLDLPHPQAAHGPAASDPAGGSDRARRLVHLGELAPGNEATLAELRDPARRPAASYSALPSEVLFFQPAEPAGTF